MPGNLARTEWMVNVMKTIECGSFFKKVSAKQAELNPAMGQHVGQKRPDVKWSFEGFASSADLESASHEHVMFFLNAALEAYGRELIAAPENASNWEFVPTGLTLAAAFTAATTKAERSRTLTKVTAAAFATFYAAHASELLGIPVASAKAAQAVLVDWISFSRKETFRAAMYARLNQFATAICELAEDSPVFEEFTASEVDLSGVLAALIKAFDDKVVEDAISADAL